MLIKKFSLLVMNFDKFRNSFTPPSAHSSTLSCTYTYHEGNNSIVFYQYFLSFYSMLNKIFALDIQFELFFLRSLVLFAASSNFRCEHETRSQIIGRYLRHVMVIVTFSAVQEWQMVARMVGECRDKYNGCPEQCRENVTLKEWKRNDDRSNVGQDILNRITIHR